MRDEIESILLSGVNQGDDEDVELIEVRIDERLEPGHFEQWMVASVEDPEHRHAEVVEPFAFIDGTDPEVDAPSPVGDERAQLWGYREVDGKVDLTPLGILSPGNEAPILTVGMPVAAAASLSWLPLAQAAPTVGGPCPTRNAINGSGTYTTAPYRSRAAARSAADRLAVSQAKTDAGLAELAFRCPNAGCQKKELQRVFVFRSRTTHWSLIGSVGWAESRYYAAGTYSWFSWIVCT